MLIFGEAVLNDAVAIVINRCVAQRCTLMRNGRQVFHGRIGLNVARSLAMLKFRAKSLCMFECECVLYTFVYVATVCDAN